MTDMPTNEADDPVVQAPVTGQFHLENLHARFAAPGTVSHRLCGKKVPHHGKHPNAVDVVPPGAENVRLNKHLEGN